jgi:hypothetical protein
MQHSKTLCTALQATLTLPDTGISVASPYRIPNKSRGGVNSDIEIQGLTPFKSPRLLTTAIPFMGD